MNKDFSHYLSQSGEVGFVRRAIASLVYVEGLPSAQTEELIAFESGEFGQVMALNKDALEILSFARTPIKVGIRAARTGTPFRYQWEKR